jgi:hypothetical protein
MSEEKKDLSSLDGITDRVARAKAKAEAMKAAKAAAGTQAASPSPEARKVSPSEASPRPEPVPGPASETKADLSNLDGITDRVARAKAKAEAMKAARAAGDPPDPPSASAKADEGRAGSGDAEAAGDRVARAKAKAEAARAARAAGAAPASVDRPAPASRKEPGPPSAPREVGPAPVESAPEPVHEMFALTPGTAFRRDGRLAVVTSAQGENIGLAYQDAPGQRMMAKRYQLEVEGRRGTLRRASRVEFTGRLPGSRGRAIAIFGAILLLIAAVVAGILSR